MNLKKAMNRQAVSLRLQSDTKDGVIKELTELLLSAGLVKDREAILDAVLDRESKMSTGMQNGIAIPHGKSDSVPALVSAVGIHPEGIDFDSIDGLPCRIFILTVSPVNRSGPHIQFLAEISRLLNNKAVRDQLLTATSEDDILKALIA